MMTNSSMAVVIAAKNSEKDGLVSVHIAVTAHAPQRTVSQNPPAGTATLVMTMSMATTNAITTPVTHRIMPPPPALIEFLQGSVVTAFLSWKQVTGHHDDVGTL